MKSFPLISKKMLMLAMATGLPALMLTSCLKNHNNYVAPPSGLVTFIQASPDEPAATLFMNQNQVSSTPIYFKQGIDYFRVYTGQRQINVFNYGTMSQIASDTLTVAANKAYSVFLVNTSANPQLFHLTDTLNKPSAGNAGIRFIDLSPDAANVDLAVKGGQVLVADRTFKGYSSFVPLAGNATYTFDVRQTGTNTVLASLPDFKVNSGFVYTVIFCGLAHPLNSTDGLSVVAVTNAYF